MKSVTDTVVPDTHMKYMELKVAMLMHFPFFASLLFDLMVVKVGKFPSKFGSREPTAATDGKTIYFDVDFMESLPLASCCFVMCHEIGHAMWHHIPRAKGYIDAGFDGAPFRPLLWNIAGDYVINAMLVESEVPGMPKQGLLNTSRFPHSMLVDDVYRELLKNVGSDGMDIGSMDETLDTHLNEEADTTLDVAAVRQALASAAAAAKAMGKLPDNLKRIVADLIEPQVSWHHLLRVEVTRCVGREATTWSRPHRRRLLTQGVFLPAYTGHGSGTIVVVVDTSGSIGAKELCVFLSEVEGILSTCHPAKVYLIGCDAEINTVHELGFGDSLVNNMPVLGGGGGTSFVPPFDWVEENEVRPSALVYLTDMAGTFPEPADYPTIWCSTSPDEEGPFGRTVHITINTGDE